MLKKLILIIVSLVLIIGCEPVVEKFETGEHVKTYKSKEQSELPKYERRIKFMTFNIRFGVGRMGWFGDSCGDYVIVEESVVVDNLNKIAEFVEQEQPDVVFLQEVDIESKRTAYVDQVKYLLNKTYFNHAVYASMWEAQYVPSDGLGRINVGNAILSRWELTDAERIALPLRGDQDDLTEYFYMRRNMIKAKLLIPEESIDFHVFNVHMSAFSTDDTKARQMEMIVSELELMNTGYWVLGGDFNLIPPTATKIDYCHVDACEDSEYHKGDEDDQEYHLEGSYFGNDIDLMYQMYNRYYPAVILDEYSKREDDYFSHSTSYTGGFWDRKIDYLFTKKNGILVNSVTHQQEAYNDELSDHVPVSAIWEAIR
jgi:endonuclease/exonuclease/phosphatase family metal-dependent hydrolase